MLALAIVTPALSGLAAGPAREARIAWLQTGPVEARAVAFSGSFTGGDATWSWSFGDGTTGAGPAPTHAYADNGVYTVTATATGSDGSRASATRAVTVGNAPCGAGWERLLQGVGEFAATAATASGDTAFFAGSSRVYRLQGGVLASLGSPVKAWTGLHAASASDLYAVAGDGAIHRWTGSWSTMTSPAASLADLGGAGASVWAAGDAVYRLQSGAWVLSLLAPAGATFVEVEAPDAATSFAADSAGGFHVFRSNSWSSAPAVPGGAPAALLARGASDVLAANGAGVHRFDGAAWSTLASAPAAPAALGVREGEILLGSASGLFRLTAAGWLREPLQDGPVEALATTPTSTFAFGAGRAIRMSGAASEAASLTGKALLRVASSGGSALASAEEGGVLRFDGGAWRPTAGTTPELAALALLPDGNGYAASASSILRITGDSVTPVAAVAGMRDLTLVSATDGWAVGDGGAIRRFDGASWTAVASPTAQRLWGVALASPSHGYAVGEGGTVLAWDGASWTRIASGTTRILRDVAFAPDGAAHAVGDSVALRIVSASTVVAIASGTYRALEFGGGFGYAVGDAGRIAQWNGASWSAVASPVASSLKDVSLVGGDFLAVGDAGTALRLRTIPCLVADFAPPAPQVEGTSLLFRDASAPAPHDAVTAWWWTFGDGTTSTARDPTKAYANQGSFGVRLTATDDDGQSASKTITLAVLDATPAPALDVPETVTEGDAVVLDASGSLPGSPTDAIARYEWDPEGDGTFVVGAATRSVSWSAQGPARPAVRVVDEDSSATLARDLVVLDAVPQADPGPSLTVGEGAPVSLDGSASRATPADPIGLWEWDLDPAGPFQADRTGVTATASWLADGAHHVDLRVTDEDGSASVARLLVTVENRAPTASVATPSPTPEGDLVTLAATASDPGDDPLQYAWDFTNDGTWDTALAASPSATTSYAEDGVYTARVLVTDGLLSTIASVTVRIDDTLPHAVAGADLSATEGDRVTLDGGLSWARDGIVAHAWDVGADGTWDLVGARPALEVVEGSTRVLLRVTDGDGSVAFDELRVLGLDAVPRAVVDLPKVTVCACANVTLSAAASTARAVDPIVAYEWDLAYDGTFTVDETGTTVSYVASTNGTVALRVRDSDGSVDVATSETVVACFSTAKNEGPDHAIPGEWTTYRVRVSNPTPVPVEVDVEASAPVGWAVDPDPSTFVVAAGASPAVDVHVLVPEGTAPGSTGTVRVDLRFEACIVVSISRNRTIIVDPTPARLDAEPETQSVTGVPGGAAGAALTVANRGDLDLTGIVGVVESGPWPASLVLPQTTLGGDASMLVAFATTIPDPHAKGTFPFKLNFTSANGGWDAVRVDVVIPNLAPVADAGADATHDALTLVTLNGTRSRDPNGDALAYLWTQTAGPPVVLDGATTARPTFRVPILDESASLAFQLRVTDVDGASGVDSVVVSALARGTVDLTVTPYLRDAVPGDVVEYSIVVKNNQRIQDSFDLGVTGLPAGWAMDFAGARVGPLDPGASASFTVRVTTPPLETTPYSHLPGPQRAVLAFRATSVYWSNPLFAPIPAPGDSANAIVSVPVTVKHAFAPQNIGPLDSGIVLGSPSSGVAASYSDPFEAISFNVTATFTRGVPLAGATITGTVRWIGLSTTSVEDNLLGGFALPFSTQADAAGRATVEVPFTLDAFLAAQGLPAGTGANLVGKYVITTTARLYDHRTTTTVVILVDPANLTKGGV